MVTSSFLVGDNSWHKNWKLLPIISWYICWIHIFSSLYHCVCCGHKENHQPLLTIVYHYSFSLLRWRFTRNRKIGNSTASLSAELTADHRDWKLSISLSRSGKITKPTVQFFLHWMINTVTYTVSKNENYTICRWGLWK